MIREYRKSKILEYLHLSFNNWPSIQYKFWVFLVLWNHNNGEHCWLGNGPEDDHRHPPQRGQVTEGHYWKVWLFTECCIKVNQMQSWLEGRNWVGKCAQAKGMTISLRILLSKADSNTWESFTRSELKLESCRLPNLAPAHIAHVVTVLDWPANSPDLNPIENLWGIVNRKMRDTRPNNGDDLKATIKATWASITHEQCHRLMASIPRRIDAVIHAKGGPTKYWVHRNEHTFQKPVISV